MTLHHITKAVLLSMALASVACGGSGKEAESPEPADGTMEEAGEELDEAADDVEDEMEDVGDEIEEETEEM